MTWIQRLSTLLAISQLRHSRLGAPNLWALTLRTSEFARSLDLCHLSSSDGRLRFSRDFATREVEGLPSLNPDREDLATCALPIGQLRFFRYFGIFEVECSDFRPLDPRTLEHRYPDLQPFRDFASVALCVRFKPHATLDRSNDCQLFRPRSDGSDLSFHGAFPTLPGHESTVQILSADPTTTVLLLSFCVFFLHFQEF
jgi:hypothetical protein